MTPGSCRACLARPTRDTRTLCDQCAWEIASALEALPDLINELWVTFTRQANTSRNVGKTGRRNMVVYDLRVAELRDDVFATLHRWTVTIDRKSVV